MKLFVTTLNATPAFVFAESTDSAIAKFNRLRRVLCISDRLKLVKECPEITTYRTTQAHQSQTLLGEPLYLPNAKVATTSKEDLFASVEASLRSLLLEVA